MGTAKKTWKTFYINISLKRSHIAEETLPRISWLEQTSLLAGQIRSRLSLLPADRDCSFHNDALIRRLNGYGAVIDNVTTLCYTTIHLRGPIHV